MKNVDMLPQGYLGTNSSMAVFLFLIGNGQLRGENHKELTNKPFQPPFLKIVKHQWNFTNQIKNPNLVVVTIAVYWFTIFAGSSHVSHVSIYFFVAALIWITASLLHLHVCKELMDLPPFRRPRNTQTI